MTEDEYNKWVALREEVFKSRQSADAAKRYYRRRAEHFRRVDLVLNAGSLLTQASAIGALFSAAAWWATGLTLAATVMTVAAALLRNADRRAEHLAAARATTMSHARWDKLWREISGTPTWGSTIEHRIHEADAADREVEIAMTDGLDEALWKKMEQAAVQALDPRELSPEQPAWVREVGIVPKGL